MSRYWLCIADDDPGFLKITKQILDSCGYETHTAYGGAEARKIMRSACNKLDSVLLNVMMDHITDGFDVSSAMRWDPTLRGIPVMMITSLTGVRSPDIFARDEYGAVKAWLSKPVKTEELLRMVQKTLVGVPAAVSVGVPAVS